MREHKNIGGTDFHGTCTDTGKRQYGSRRHAKKARQIHSHTRGTPYLCAYCHYWHIGHYRKRKTRDGYRDMLPGHIGVEALAKQLHVSYEATIAALNGLGIPVQDDQVPLDTLNKLQPLTYRDP